MQLTETVGDIYEVVRSDAATVPEDATLRDAVDAILAREVTRKAYVVDGEGHVKGTISLETLMRHVSYRLGARKPGLVSFFRFVREMETDRVVDFMRRPTTVTLETNVVEVVRKVVEDHLNDFPIVDGEGRLLGELNTLNLLKAARGIFPKHREG
ncbi:MAG: CBS domain-containing protein [Euryarchaeota archaeon]|nr:CBS domain-containing protein [Euryarchaeota archaeon]